MSDIISRLLGLLQLNEKWTTILENAFKNNVQAEENLHQWYREQKWVRSIVYFLLILSALNVLSLIQESLPPGNQLAALSHVDVSQVFFWSEIGVIIVVTLNIIFSGKPRLNKKSPALKSASHAADRFLNFWPLLWASWFALYMLLALDSAGIKLFASDVAPAMLNLINNLSGVLLFSMYFEMAFKTEPDEENEGFHPTRLWIPASMILLVFWALELIALKSTRGLLQAKVVTGFSLFSGILVGLAAGLLVTKLSNKAIGTPFWAIAALSLYATIQPVFPLISKPSDNVDRHFSQIFVMIALYGKMLLLCMVHWVRDSKRLIYYMLRAAQIHEQEEDERFRQFFKIAVEVVEENDAEPKPTARPNPASS